LGVNESLDIGDGDEKILRGNSYCKHLLRNKLVVIEDSDAPKPQVKSIPPAAVVEVRTEEARPKLKKSKSRKNKFRAPMEDDTDKGEI
jgi:hypothetical protein